MLNTGEQQIQAEVELLKTQFPNTRELYREVCVLLFFRYGITPTANKLYQYVRKGSMSAPAEALNKFWLEMREKSRVRIESPDLPEQLKEAAGSLVSSLWSQAQRAAQTNFSDQISEANGKIADAHQDTATAIANLEAVERKLHATQADLEIALQNVSEAEKIQLIHISTLASFEKSLLELQKERDSLKHDLYTTREGFSRDLDKVNVSLGKAEERFKALETKALIEIDRERQKSRNVEKELRKLKARVQSDQLNHQRELMSAQTKISYLSEKYGTLKGELIQCKSQLKSTTRQLTFKERELMAVKSKLRTK